MKLNILSKISGTCVIVNHVALHNIRKFSVKSIYAANCHRGEVYHHLCFVHKERNFLVDMIKWDINDRSYEAQALDQDAIQ